MLYNYQQDKLFKKKIYKTLTYTYVSKGNFELREKPKPVLLNERDAIVKVTLASICSSDLHIKHGNVPCWIWKAFGTL